jgi:hypothetical protein
MSAIKYIWLLSYLSILDGGADKSGWPVRPIVRVAVQMPDLFTMNAWLIMQQPKLIYHLTWINSIRGHVVPIVKTKIPEWASNWYCVSVGLVCQTEVFTRYKKTGRVSWCEATCTPE